MAKHMKQYLIPDVHKRKRHKCKNFYKSYAMKYVRRSNLSSPDIISYRKDYISLFESWAMVRFCQHSHQINVQIHAILVSRY